MKWARTNMFTHAASACWPLKQKGPRLLPSWGSILMAAANAANVNLRKCCPGMCVCVRVCVLWLATFVQYYLRAVSF